MTPISLFALMHEEQEKSYLFSSVEQNFILQNKNTPHYLDLDDPEVTNKRLMHTIKWCIQNECNHSYDQAFFVEKTNTTRVLGRRISVIFHNLNWIDIRVSAVNRYESALFTSHFDERIVNAMSDAFLITEADAINLPGPRIVYCNDAYTKMCGYSREEVHGQTPRMLQGAGSSHEAKKNIKVALQNWKSINQRIINYRKDGSQFIVELHISPMADETGWYTHWVSVQRDVSTEQADIELVKQSKFILESNHIACWNYHVNDDYCYFDAEMMSQHETSAHEFDNKLSTWFSLIYEPDLKKFRDSLTESITQKIRLDIEYRVMGKSGELKLLKLTSRHVIDDISGAELLAGTCFDITHERQSEKEIEKHRQIAIENAKLASIGQLASGVGHEINNPLSVITASIEMIEAKLTGYVEASNIAQPWFAKITNACHRISKIIDGLRSVSTINRDICDLESINLYSDAFETLNLFKELSETKGITFTISMQTDIDSCWFHGDHSRFQQILVNILNNAKDAAMEVIDKRIDCVITSDATSCQLCIIDSGRGIDANAEHRIFEPFVTTKPVGKGTGLGLSITHSIVKSFNGEINFKVLPQVGTSFKIEFPRAHPHIDN